MREVMKSMFEKVTGSAKKEEEKQRLVNEVGAAVRNCLAMRNGENSLVTLQETKKELSKIPYPYTDEGNRLWELKKVEFDSNMQQNADFIRREIRFVKESGVNVTTAAIEKMEELRKEYLAMKFSETRNAEQFNTGGNVDGKISR